MPKAISIGPKPPQQGTLNKYGLTVEEWKKLCKECNYTCFVCGKEFGDRPLVVDHEHAAGFRATKKIRFKDKKKKGYKRVRVMPPEERRQHVRGVLHNYCNRFVRRWLTLERARAIVAYLERHHSSRKSI